MKPLDMRECSEKNFKIKPVSGGSPPRDKMVKIVIIILEGDSWDVAFKCPSVNAFEKLNTKNIVVLITRYISSMATAAL